MSGLWTKEGDQSIPNVTLCLLLVLIESLQLLIVLVLIFSFIPIPVAPIVHTLFPRNLQLVQPGREMFFYRFWVISFILGQTALLVGLKDQLKNPQLAKRLKPFCMAESLWLFLQVFAVFKIFVYGYPAWAFHLLYAFIAGSLLSKVFWKELKIAFKIGRDFLLAQPMIVQKAADILSPLLIAAILFVPDLQSSIARMWIGDNLHHFDTALMAQAWAYLKGAIINVDVYEHYGLGMPIFTGLLAKLLGIFSYEGILGILIWVSIIYFILCYFFLRAWLKSIPVAIAGTLIAIKWKMFHPGVYPFVFTYPDTTVIRHVFDIFFLFLLLAHLRRGNFYFLAAAALVCGLSLFYVSDTGVYLLLAYVFYLCWLIAEGWGKAPMWKNTLRPVLLCGLIVVISTLFLFYAFQGHYAWSRELWANMSEQIALFLAGHGDLPMYKSLLDGDYWASMMSFVIPLVYAGVLLGVVSLCFLKKIRRENIMVAVICVYGMGLYHYYVCRSADTSYYTVGIPFAFVLCWLGRYVWWWAILGLSAFALFSNHYFLSYPDIFNFSANPIIASDIRPVVKDLPFYFNNISRNMSPALKLSANSLGQQDEELKIETDFKSDAELKEYFNSEFSFSEDAGLIDRLTSPGEKVALISSFETRILMQADRASFFYYFPVIDSRPMRMRMFPFTSLLSTYRLNKTMRELQEGRPPYIFMEKILLAQSVPSPYEYLYPELLVILSYIHQHYGPYEQGHYLIAMKRKDFERSP